METVVFKGLKYCLYLLSIVIILVAGFIIYLIWFQPPFYFPKPTGPYAVSTKLYHWNSTVHLDNLTVCGVLFIEWDDNDKISELRAYCNPQERYYMGQ